MWGGTKTKDLVVYVKVNWYPLTSVWDQSSPKLTSTLFAGLPYARNRSLDRDLFCGGSSARLPSTSHAHKMDSRPGIIIYATSHLLLQLFQDGLRCTLMILAPLSYILKPILFPNPNFEKFCLKIPAHEINKLWQ